SMSELSTFHRLLPSTWVEENGHIRLPPPHPSRVYKPSDSPLLTVDWPKELIDPGFFFELTSKKRRRGRGEEKREDEEAEGEKDEEDEEEEEEEEEERGPGPSPPLSSSARDVSPPTFSKFKKYPSSNKYLRFRTSSHSNFNSKPNANSSTIITTNTPHSPLSSSHSSLFTHKASNSPSPLLYPLRSLSDDSYRYIDEVRNKEEIKKEVFSSSSSSSSSSPSSPLYLKKGLLSIQDRSHSSELHNLSTIKKKRANFSKKTKDLLLLWLEEHLE
ncbi:hypothetical protein HMI56_004088, partial [Coelomomyces lativittatus]